MYQTTVTGLGQSTCVGIGGDRSAGTNFVAGLPREVRRRSADGGNHHDRRDRRDRGGGGGGVHHGELQNEPVVSFIGGLTAPPGMRMGHAGAIIAGGKGGAGDKIAALKAAGVTVVPSPAGMGKAMLDIFNERKML